MTVSYLFQSETVAAEDEEGGQTEAVVSDLPDPAEFVMENASNISSVVWTRTVVLTSYLSLSVIWILLYEFIRFDVTSSFVRSTWSPLLGLGCVVLMTF